MLSFRVVILAIAASSAFAQTITGATQCIPAGGYTLCQNLWGASSGTGSQSSTLNSASGNSVSWSTNWNWQNGQNDVKSYANVQSNSALGVQLNSISSVPSTFNWNYQSQSNVRADVSYDIWLGSASSGNPASSASNFEIMIWLSGKGGVQPLGSQVATGINLGGQSWNLWAGPNSNWEVYSFVAANGDINNFSSDLNLFFQYLVHNKGVSGSQYIQSIQAGTEPFTGAANLVISSYSVSINRGTPPSGTTTTAPSSTPTSGGGGSGTAAHYGQCGGQGWTGPTTCASPYTCQVSNPYYSQCL